MTEYSEVRVGDIVTLRSKRHPTSTLTGEVREVAVNPLDDSLYVLGHGWASDSHWEIIEYQPKPFALPTEPGWYVREVDVLAGGTPIYRLDDKGNWVDRMGQPVGDELRQARADLVSLVPVSDVEGARAKVVKEIVEMLRAEARYVEANAVRDKFGAARQ